MGITVDRGGVTSNHWYDSGIKAQAKVFGRELKIRFRLDSKGGGRTEVQVNIGQQSFQELMELMLKCDFEFTVNCFGKALVRRESSAVAQ